MFWMYNLFFFGCSKCSGKTPFNNRQIRSLTDTDLYEKMHSSKNKNNLSYSFFLGGGGEEWKDLLGVQPECIYTRLPGVYPVFIHFQGVFASAGERAMAFAQFVDEYDGTGRLPWAGLGG